MNSVVSASTADAAAGDPEAFAYFYDAEDIGRALADWPEDIRLAVCLDAEGTCEFIVFHAEEEGGILTRIGRILDRGPGAFATSPGVEGYPERRLLFSEESALLRVLIKDPDILERAQDYDINYRFARDEGLDPEIACADVAPRRPNPRSRAARRSVRKIFPLAERRAPVAAVPEGFTVVAPPPPASPAPTQFRATIRKVDGHVRIAADGASGAAIAIDRVAVRDDLGSLHIPADALDGIDPQTTPLDLPASLFPCDFVGARPRSARVSALGSGLFVTPAKPVARDPLPGAVTALRVTRRLGRGVRLPVLAGVSLLATGFLSAMVAHAVTDTGSRSLWSGTAPSIAVFGTQQSR